MRGNFDDCLRLARELAEDYPVALVNSVNPVRLEGQKTAAFEIVDALGDAPDIHLLPVGNAGNITAYWQGYTQYADLGRATTDARGCAASRPRAPRRSCSASRSTTRRPWPPRSGSATRPRGSWPRRPRDESGGRIEAVTDEQILAAQRELAAREGVFVEPASAAGVAGLLARRSRPGESYAGQHRRRHGHRPRPQGHRDRAARAYGPLRRRRRGRRRRRRRAAAAGAGLDGEPAHGLRRRRGPGPRPGDAAPTSGPGFDSLGLALALRDELDGRGRRRTASTVEVDRRGRRRGPARRDAPRRPGDARRRFDAMRRARRPGCAWRCRNAHPARPRPRLVRRPRSSAGLVAGAGAGRRRRRLGSTTRRLLELAAEIEGHPDNVAPALLGGFVDLVARDGATRSYAVRLAGRPAGRRGRLRAARRRCRPRWPAGCCPRPCRTPTPPPTPGGPRCWSAALAGAPEHLLPATQDCLHQDYRRAGDARRRSTLVERAAGRRHRRGRLRRRADGARVLPRTAVRAARPRLRGRLPGRLGEHRDRRSSGGRGRLSRRGRRAGAARRC